MKKPAITCPRCGAQLDPRSIGRQLAARGGSAGKGAAKARTTAQARAAARARWARVNGAGLTGTPRGGG